MFTTEKTEPNGSRKPVKNERAALASFVFWLAVFALADQGTKFLAFRGQALDFLEALRPVAGLQPFLNYQFAFSLPVPGFLMYGAYGVILALMLRYLAKNFRRLTRAHRCAWLLILAGALSNVLERVVLGYVRDFVYVLSGIFNLADGYIIAGVAILLAQSARRKM